MAVLARKKPLHFAFNPGKSAADHVLGLDKRKAPAIIGKAIKASGQGVKVSFGLFEVDGKILMLTTENSLPTMAKKVKAFLKLNKVKLNVVVRDPNGTVLDQDIEELPDDEAQSSAPADAPVVSAVEASVPHKLGQKLDALTAQTAALPESGVSGQGDISTDCLLKLLQLGAGPKPGGISTSEDLTRRCDALVGIAAKMDDSAAAGLKTILANGGLGTDPEVLGQLVGIGCEGDGDGFANLAKELAKDDTPARLKDALQKAGLGSLDDAGTATGTATTCLAKLLNPGSDGDPAELAKLLNALDSTQKLADLKGVMITGELGNHPEVLGDLYRNGCLASPDGAADGSGAKEPQVLIDMIGEFRGTDAGKFKELMTTAGFDSWDATNGVSRLGSVMRYGFTPDGGSQDGKKLRQLYDAFKPSSTNDHLADLETTLAALEAAPDWVLETSTAGAPNQPGKGMRNVMFAGSHNGSPSDLHSIFFTELQTYATANATSGAVGRLSLDELIQNAASFEHEPVPLGSGSSTVTLSDGTTAQLRLDHVLDRHTRKYQDFQHTKTTLYPRQVTETEIEEIAASTLDSLGSAAPPRQFSNNALGPDPSPNRPPAHPPPGAKRNPPQDMHDLRGDYVFYDLVPGTYDDTGGAQAVTSKIGFVPTPLTIGPPPEIYVGQLFPRTGPDLITVHKHDMRAMKQALAL